VQIVLLLLLFSWVHFIYSGYRVSYPGINWTVHGLVHPILSSADIKAVVELYLTPHYCASIGLIVVYVSQMVCFLSYMLVTLSDVNLSVIGQNRL